MKSALLLLLAFLPTQTSIGADQKDKVVSNNWYTITINRVIKYAYYNESLTIKGDKIHHQTNLWKQEEGYINEESMGAFALNNQDVTPLFYNFRSTYRTTETKIDGTVVASKNGKRSIQVKINKGKSDLPLVKKGITKRVFFSVFFPVWIKNHFKELKKKKSLTFYTILEDNLETDFRTVTGRVKLTKPDPYAKKTKSHRLLVKYRELKSTWWIKENGKVLRIIMPKQKTVIELSTKEKAENFFSR